jgi:hypothetical protein
VYSPYRVYFSQACVLDRRVTLTGHTSHRPAALTGHTSRRPAFQTGVQLSQGIHLAGLRPRQAYSSHRAYISQACVLDRPAALIGHASHRVSDYDLMSSHSLVHCMESRAQGRCMVKISSRSEYMDVIDKFSFGEHMCSGIKTIRITLPAQRRLPPLVFTAQLGYYYHPSSRFRPRPA